MKKGLEPVGQAVDELEQVLLGVGGVRLVEDDQQEQPDGDDQADDVARAPRYGSSDAGPNARPRHAVTRSRRRDAAGAELGAVFVISRVLRVLPSQGRRRGS